MTTRGRLLRPLVAAALVAAACALGTVARPAGATTPVRIAIVDSGIQADHPQFASGQVVAWRDFVSGSGAPFDDQGHGTAVASLAAGSTLGSYPGAQLVVAKVLNASNMAQWGVVADAIRWSADQGADVINVSLWQNGLNPTTHGINLARAIDYAAMHGSLVVWIAGNGGIGLPSSTLPGAASPTALVVGASDSLGRPASFSQLDPEVLARGVNVTVATPGSTYAVGSGTSYAAPRAAGIVGRMIAAGAPRDVDWLKWVTLHSATDQAAPYAQEGYGNLDATAVSKALAVSSGHAPVPGVDSRDAFHVPSSGLRSAQSGSVPRGALPPR